ncbi:ppGpp synthetase/RelA/SpoT-type nucleotidyltransferase [Sporomusaceae bacterium BoRhaA]|uniref:GTP pyrophosphokinase n=1 Tax=Pelorhabdus rhamnosifermentans TaxID=2772457 RepID=UPI001C06414F|nr:hypothetical protein [Pelorhabdus rhamnosifermentans]MBU2700733.1 ppGpp synthetase/RelA/SpoT-type nucleotidyltransferase [Pelorhabdus rhamnosifermentans]
MSEIIETYRQNYSFYQEFTGRMESLMSILLQEQNIRVHSVVSRVKEESSLKNKLVNSNKSYAHLQDITDLCGIRIITYFEDEVNQVADFIQKEFAIDVDNSIDKRKVLAPDRFGYLSLHLIVTLSDERLQLKEYQKFAGCKVEIQIRSILQHAWAEIEHDLEYKRKALVSYETRRNFSRLAGLLEIVDLEFEKIRDQVIVPSNVPALLPTRELVPLTFIRKNSLVDLAQRWIFKLKTPALFTGCITLAVLFSVACDVLFASEFHQFAAALSSIKAHV